MPKTVDVICPHCGGPVQLSVANGVVQATALARPAPTPTVPPEPSDDIMQVFVGGSNE